jgi:6-carboxyhexanoate--CoA ligase
VSVDPLGDALPSYFTSLDVATLETPDYLTGRQNATRVLKLAGVSEQAAAMAMDLINKGAALNGANMRGAMIMDAVTGERLESDQSRGIRSSRFDWTDEASLHAKQQLAAVGLSHYRTAEALALATKVAHAPGMIAELCWSDEPDYTAGYVASLSTGYVRFPFLKQCGDTHGGRAFFVDHDHLDLAALIRYLESEAVLINSVGSISTAMVPQAFFDRMTAHV